MSDNYLTVRDWMPIIHKPSDISRITLFHNQWRNNPLVSYPIIKPNIAGYYQHQQKIIDVKPKSESAYEYLWKNSCNTVLPPKTKDNKEREIILYR